MLGFIGTNGAITMPDFETVLPRESLGISFDDDGNVYKQDC